ncbi:hypothetical protein [Pseudalkalibacillus berkeleyi]|uniref:Uncharacterized protein n=1 Tax=Pseudalkalibacillus berkeleyi TaxID=1069813 RepID=A0ABS9H1B7_9BACL|nr:hypothetical protein [Pseudalkalibacillus berkeleyi]MCF6137745.1 hypothetical protein [Pseudalkalibacillus berkeleyi]
MDEQLIKGHNSFLKSRGELVEPIFSNGEVEGEKDEYIMIFAPVIDLNDVTLQVGETIQFPLNK